MPWVIRAPSDGGIRSGPFHSQNPEAWFVHTPGLKVVAPATPADAKGLLTAAIRDNNPVIYFESKPLYRSLKGDVPAGEYVVPLGEAHTARAGGDLSIITYGAQVHDALERGGTTGRRRHPSRGARPAHAETAGHRGHPGHGAKTGKVLVVHSANQLAGIGAEVTAIIAEQAFEWLGCARTAASAAWTRPSPSARRWRTPTARTRARSMRF